MATRTPREIESPASRSTIGATFVDQIAAAQQSLAEADLDGWRLSCFQRNDPVRDDDGVEVTGRTPQTELIRVLA